MESGRILIFLGLVSLAAAQLDTIFIRSYRAELSNYTDIRLENINDLFPLLTPSERLTVYIHGWEESVESSSVKLVVGAYLNYTKENIVALDYSQSVSGDYISAMANVEPVATAVATALDKLVDDGWNRNNLHIVGHSLGGQVASRIGRNTTFRIPRITGLDPAGPLFVSFLSSGDAECVDIIHTDKGGYGQLFSTGDLDFQPNAGSRIQPGCPLVNIPLSDGDFCSHHRSYDFYAASIQSPDSFVGILCTSEFAFVLGHCNKQVIAPMGYAATCSYPKGNYYLQTDSKSPFGLGLQGTTFNVSEIFG